MPRQTKLTIKKCSIKEVEFWQVTTPLPGGGRQRRTFKDEAVAEEFLELKRIELRNRGTAGIAMGDQIRGDALAAAAILKPLGASLTDAARFYAAHHEKLAKSETVSTAIAAFLSHKQPDSRPRYLKDLRLRLGRFTLTFGERKLAELNAGELQDWANSIPNLATGGKLSARSRNTYLVRVSALLSYSKDRGWVTQNVLKGLKKAKVRSDEEVGILTLEQVRSLLENAGERSLPYFCIGLFAGLRTGELEKLNWESVHWADREIEVKAWTARTGSKRFVQMKEPLISWLQPHLRESGRIFPGRKAVEADRSKAGLLKDWPHNALRHSFASYSLAHFKDNARLSLDLGHMNPKLVFEKYHQVVKSAAGAKFWGLKPK